MQNEYSNVVSLRAVIPRRPFIEGDKVKLADILGKTLIFTDWEVMQSKINQKQEYMKLQFIDNGKFYILFTASGPLMRTVNEFVQKRGKQPFEATIKKNNGYFYFE